MEKQAVNEEIKRYLRLGKSGGDLLTDQTPLLEGWFIDSMAIVTLVVFLEKQFGIKMGPADITAENFSTVDALSTFITAKMVSG